MRYQKPTITSKSNHLRDGQPRILFPLFPHFQWHNLEKPFMSSQEKQAQNNEKYSYI